MTNFELFGVQIGGGEIGCAIRGGCWLLRAHNRRGIRVFTFDLHNRGMSGSFPCKGVGNWGWCCAQGLCTLAELNLGSRWRAQYAVNIWCPVEAGRASVRRNSRCNRGEKWHENPLHSEEMCATMVLGHVELELR
jgi:hypothetical protein